MAHASNAIGRRYHYDYLNSARMLFMPRVRRGLGVHLLAECSFTSSLSALLSGLEMYTQQPGEDEITITSKRGVEGCCWALGVEGREGVRTPSDRLLV